MSVEVLDRDIKDPDRSAAQVARLQQRLGLSAAVLAGNQAMLTEARFREHLQPAALDWIIALPGSATRPLVDSGTMPIVLPGGKDPVEGRSDSCPGERVRPLLWEDGGGEVADAAERSAGAPARQSQVVQAGTGTGCDLAGDLRSGFASLLSDLATITRNTVEPRRPEAEPFAIITQPTPRQREAFRLLGVQLPGSP